MATKSDHMTIGSRGSELALWQAHWVEKSLQRHYARLQVLVRVIKTKGDKILDSPLSKIGDKGLFTREIENALLSGEVDIAVHSLKDLPTELPKGLTIGAICEREDVRDVFIPHPGNPIRRLLDQPQSAKIATGSLRRKCQLLHLRPDIQIIDLRGNLNSRLKKLDGSDWSGILLARAGVVRLGWGDRIGETIDAKHIMPAVGQGALALEIREGDERVRDIVSALHHRRTAQAVMAERSLLRALEGGCQVPIGTYARVEAGDDGNDILKLDAVVGSVDGKTVVRGKLHGRPEDSESLGKELAHILIASGAGKILDDIRAGARKGVPDYVDA